MTPLTITAVRELPLAAGHVYAYLVQLENHRYLGGPQLRVDRLDEDRRGGRIIIAAPLGLRRVARTTVTTLEEPHRFGGVAHVGRSTRAHVHWSVEHRHSGARVVLEAHIASAGMVDRALLGVGGRWWLRRAFQRALERLAEALEGECARPEPIMAAVAPA